MDEDWAERLVDARRRLDDAHAARDRAVRDAAAAGMPKTHIAAAVGLSAMHVHRLLRADR